MPASDVNRTIDAVWRIESARLIAGLARIVRDVGVAEDLAQEALVAALEQWPESGVPENPGAWLMGTAKHRAVDRLRRAEVHERTTRELGLEIEIRGEVESPDLEAGIDDPFDDDLLRLIFTACHPVLSTDARVALTLRLLAGLTTREIARAYLVSEATVAQRIVRAKRTLAEARVPFEALGRDELAERLASVLEAIYLIFNEGYAATAGDDWIRPELIEEALRLGRIPARHAPGPQAARVAASSAARRSASTPPNATMRRPRNWSHCSDRSGRRAPAKDTTPRTVGQVSAHDFADSQAGETGSAWSAVHNQHSPFTAAARRSAPSTRAVCGTTLRHVTEERVATRVERLVAEQRELRAGREVRQQNAKRLAETDQTSAR